MQIGRLSSKCAGLVPAADRNSSQLSKGLSQNQLFSSRLRFPAHQGQAAPLWASLALFPYFCLRTAFFFTATRIKAPQSWASSQCALQGAAGTAAGTSPEPRQRPFAAFTISLSPCPQPMVYAFPEVGPQSCALGLLFSVTTNSEGWAEISVPVEGRWPRSGPHFVPWQQRQESRVLEQDSWVKPKQET